MVLPRSFWFGVVDMARVELQAVKPVEHNGSAWTFGQPLLVTGQFFLDAKTPLNFTQTDLQQYADNFNAGVKLCDGTVPFTLDHDDSRGQAGLIHRVEAKPGVLVADIEWTKLGETAITDKTFPRVSPDLHPVWTDASGRTHRNVLGGAALVVRPFLKNLPPPTLHFSEDGAHQVLLISEEETMPTESADVPVRTDKDEPNGTAAAPQADVIHLSERLAAAEQALNLERLARRRVELGAELETLTFSETGAKLAPASRGPLAEALAELSLEQQSKVLDAVKAIRLYEPRVFGHDGKPAAPGAQDDPQLASFKRQLGVDEGSGK